jgi:Type VI secretion system/phage-baseplate injector OB domain
MPQFFGKYRGKVAATKDPLHLGRLQVQVPAIFGTETTSWALPCTPYAGKDIGFFTIPPVGANIWVEFEEGDPDYPIWSGCFWGEDELPVAAKVAEPDQVQVFKTNGITVIFSNFGDNKGLTIEVKSPVVDRPLKMIFNANGIEINNNNQTTGKWLADKVELKNRENSIVTLTQHDIEVQQTSTTTKWTASSLDNNCAPATLNLSSASGIELKNTISIGKFTSSGIEFSVSPATVKLSPGSLDLQNGAASVKLSPISVNVNNGALEVI